MYNRSDTSEIGRSAAEYAEHHWQIFPLNGKVPTIAGGRGVLDATDDLDTVNDWWGGRYRGSNIGGRVPTSMVVIDVDPRNGGDTHIQQHEMGKLQPEPATAVRALKQHR